jgi:GalNAc-alpha-(1->4)-GalNAc-alpha-(1->3)-diNAcBac-PP-undecaprenol alpha-1,4-N-acetyl-D-galactosaminyltransferase
MPNPSIVESARRSLVLVIGSLEGGGAERQMSDMANYWAAKDWKVVLATWSGPAVIDFYPIDARVSRMHLAVPSEGAVGGISRVRVNLERVSRLRQLLKSTEPHAVLSFMTESNLLTILSAIGLKLRVVVSERVQPAMHSAFPWTWHRLRRVLYAWADAVVAQTGDASHWLERNCRTRAVVIPNALRALPPPSGDRESLIVAVGRLTHQKGFDVLLRAFARIAGNFKDWRLVIIGEGVERRTLTALTEELMLAARVTFVGQTPDVIAWMSKAGLVVQPSRFEGFPNVVLESMGLGAAVISSNCPSGPADLIEDGVNGRLVPVDDVETLACVMAQLMSSPEERARLGLAATAVRERYRQDAIMARWESCLFPVPACELQ